MSASTKGIMTCEVTITGGRKEELEKVITGVSTRRIKLERTRYGRGAANRNSVTTIATYGPVIGAWVSDIKKMFTQEMMKAGSTAELSILNWQRKVVEEIGKYGSDLRREYDAKRAKTRSPSSSVAKPPAKQVAVKRKVERSKKSNAINTLPAVIRNAPSGVRMIDTPKSSDR